MPDFHGLLGFRFAIALPIVFHESPDVHVYGVDHPLDDMERINDGDCIREVLIDILQIRIIHICQEILDVIALLDRQ